MTASSRARRGPGLGLGLIAALLGISALNDWAQVVDTAMGSGGEPPLLMVLHVLGGTLGVAAAVATWRRSTRAPALVVLWGAAVTILLLCVPIAVDVDAAAARGIRIAALGVALVALLLAWAVRRLLSREAAPTIG